MCTPGNSSRRAIPLLLALVLALAVGTAHGIIRQLYPLSSLVKEADSIVAYEVRAFDDRSFHLVARAHLKNRGPDRLAFEVCSDAREQNGQLLRRLRVGSPVLVMTSRFNTSKGPQPVALGYANGTWLRLGFVSSASPSWQFVHFEPYLRRTFRGTNPEMTDAVRALVAGRATGPLPNPAAPPGIGPEL